MARKRIANPSEKPAEDESQDLEEQEAVEAQEPDDTGGKGMSKTEAIRRALAAGHEGPQEGTAYIRKVFGIEIAPQHFSATKSQFKSREAAKKGKPGRKPKAAAPSQGVEGYLAPPPKPQAAGGQPDLLAAMEAMKPLVESLGKEQVKRIVELLG